MDIPPIVLGVILLFVLGVLPFPLLGGFQWELRLIGNSFFTKQFGSKRLRLVPS